MRIRRLLDEQIDAETYKKIQPEIIRENGKSLEVYSSIAMVMYAVLLVLTFFFSEIIYARWIYGTGFGLSVLIWWCCRFYGDRHQRVILPMVYVYICSTMILGMALCILDAPDVESTVFLAFLVFVPLLFIVKGVYICSIIFASSVLFVCGSYLHKYADVFDSDMLNTICFTVLSLMIGPYMSNIRLAKLKVEYENRILLQREEERHKEKIEQQLLEIQALSKEQEERLSEITTLNMQIREALETAERANLSKTRFLSQISHDIRTPLNGIIGLLELSERHPDDTVLIAKNRKKEIIAANHLLELINDVLDLTKMDDPNVTLSDEVFNILELSDDVLTITENKAAEAGITLMYQNCADQISNPYVYGSPLHVRQIALNILGNAIKYNNPGGKVLFNAKMEKIDADHVLYTCCISDTGIGMTREYLDHLFEPFTQERSDARSVYEGTGLGMSIVKSILDKMNGTIQVESEPGEGSSFTLSIPFKTAEKAIPELEKKAEADITGCRLLVVEDNELNMEIVKAILEDYGALTTEANDGKTAVDLFLKHPPGTFDLILMDLMMPVMDGLTAAKMIRELQRPDAQKIPIVAMTANAFSEDVQRCKEAGMNDHLAKPLETKKLIALIDRYWERNENR